MRSFLSEGVQLLFFPLYHLQCLHLKDLHHLSRITWLSPRSSILYLIIPGRTTMKMLSITKQPVTSIRWRSSGCSMIGRSGGSGNRCRIWHARLLLLTHRLEVVSCDRGLKKRAPTSPQLH